MIAKIKKILKMLKCSLGYSVFFIISRLFHINNKDIWLISERGYDARDNGYYFYRFIKENHPEIRIKYVISKKSPDFDKINKDDIVKYGSSKHYVLFLTAGKLISTHIMGFSPDTSLFWRLDKIGLLKLKGKKIFLQHGIIGNHVQSLEKNVAKLDMFVTSGKPETDFINSEYQYDGSSIVQCTGLPRYDTLIDESKNQKGYLILIMPTFRKWLKYESDFKTTEYYKRWNGLLNNKLFIEYIEKNNIKVVFYPHFDIQSKINSFYTKSSNITIASINKYDVQDLLKKADMLITDYSSVQFDFAYMEKKIIYYQFDKKDFFARHYQEGYFNYERDGFGDVCVNELDVIKSIANKTVSKKYINHSRRFFKYHDRNNSKRVYDQIINLDRKNILHVVSSLRRAGTETYLLNLLQGTKEECRNYVLYYTGENEWKNELNEAEVKVFKLEGDNNNKNRIKSIKKIIKEYNIDVVYTYTFYNSIFVLLTAFVFGVKERITHSHREKTDRYVNGVKRLFIRIVITLLSTNRLACSDGAGKALFINKKYQIVKNGIDASKYRFNKEMRKAIRDKMGLTDDCIVLGTVGRLDNNKNQMKMVGIVEEAIRKGLNYYLVIVGDGENRQILERTIREKSLQKRVFLIGNVNNVNDYYNIFDYFIMTSMNEGLPYVLIEAQTNGLPAIVSSSIDRGAMINNNVKFFDILESDDKWLDEIRKLAIDRVVPNKTVLDDYSVTSVSSKVMRLYYEAR